METPLSSRRVTRSQALAMSATKRENEGSEKGGFKSRQRSNGVKQEEREKPSSALFDITNSSPIAGLAMGSLNTPSKSRMMTKNSTSKQITTPGSGEVLLRGQVKTLLQKVEEESVVSKISFESRLFTGGFVNSPIALLAPTPTNTPQVPDFSATNNSALESFAVSPVAENFNFSQMLKEAMDGTNEQEESVVTRSLLMDFSEKLESYQGCENKIQVNASSTSDEFKDDEQSYVEGDENGERSEGVNDVCEGMSRIMVSGKHTRFVYNSDGELEGEEQVE